MGELTVDWLRRREKEREEVEARRAMPEGLRMKDDLERAKKSRDNKPKGQQGAFFSINEQARRYPLISPVSQSSYKSITTRELSTPFVVLDLLSRLLSLTLLDHRTSKSSRSTTDRKSTR